MPIDRYRHFILAAALALAAAYFAEGSALELKGLGVIGRRASLDQTSGAEVLWTPGLGLNGAIEQAVDDATKGTRRFVVNKRAYLKRSGRQTGQVLIQASH